jgi:hypothetical protein
VEAPDRAHTPRGAGKAGPRARSIVTGACR